MDELEHIKKIEDEVAVHVDKAKAKVEKNISAIRATREKSIKDKVDEANAQVDKELKKVKEQAEKEVADISKSTGVDLRKIDQEAVRNVDAAVELVLKEFRNIH